MATSGKKSTLGRSAADLRIEDALMAARVTRAHLQDLHGQARRGGVAAQRRLTDLVMRFPVLKVQLKALDDEDRAQRARTAHLTTGLRSSQELHARQKEIKSLMATARNLESTALVRRYERELVAVDNDLLRIRSYGGQPNTPSAWPSSSGRAAWQSAVSGGLPSLGKRR